MKRFYLQNTTLIILSTVLFFILNFIHSGTPANANWRALGDLAFIYLSITLMIGPLARIFPKMIRFVIWRRTFGVWFFIIASVHTFLIFNGWFGWNLSTYLGFTVENGVKTMINPGFGLATLIGSFTLLLSLILAITSLDKAIVYLGPRSWKWIQNFSHAIFLLISFHAIYFLIFHYANSPQMISHTRPLILTLIILTLVFLIAGFITTVKRERKNRTKHETEHEYLKKSHEIKLEETKEQKLENNPKISK